MPRDWIPACAGMTGHFADSVEVVLVATKDFWYDWVRAWRIRLINADRLAALP
jgi:hypothetical protein